jgi:hypothetical protein
VLPRHQMAWPWPTRPGPGIWYLGPLRALDIRFNPERACISINLAGSAIPARCDTHLRPPGQDFWPGRLQMSHACACLSGSGACRGLRTRMVCAQSEEPCRQGACPSVARSTRASGPHFRLPCQTCRRPSKGPTSAYCSNALRGPLKTAKLDSCT